MTIYLAIPTINGEICDKPYILKSLNDLKEEAVIYKLTFDEFKVIEFNVDLVIEEVK